MSEQSSRRCAGGTAGAQCSALALARRLAMIGAWWALALALYTRYVCIENEIGGRVCACAVWPCGRVACVAEQPLSAELSPPVP